MISLRYFLLILLTLCCRELAAEHPSIALERTLMAVIGITLGFGLMVKVAAYQSARQCLNGDAPSHSLARDHFQKYRMQIEHLWSVALPFTLLATGWFSWMYQMQESGLPQTLGITACFLPAIGFILLVEMAAAQLDECCGASDNESWTSQWLLRIRLGEMAGFLTCLFPVCLLTLASEFGDWTSDSLGVSIGWIKILTAIILMAVFTLAFPRLLTRWSAGEPLPAHLQTRMDRLTSRIGVGGVQCALIPSQHRWAGAAIVGWLPGFRSLWLGDAIVERLSAQQLDMVVLHEMAHIQRKHFAWRIIPIIWALMVAGTLWMFGCQLHLHDNLICKFLIGLTGAVCLIFGLGWMARRCELDADKTACDLAMKAADWSGVQSPAQTLNSALSNLLSEAKAREATWLHPSLERRLKELDSWSPTATAGADRGC